MPMNTDFPGTKCAYGLTGSRSGMNSMALACGLQLKRHLVLKETGAFIGDCGITMQDWNGREVPEIGYHLRRDKWHQGYAAEAARACRDYAFTVLGFPEVYSIIRDTNFPSQRVALRSGMAVRGSFVKHYRGIAMPHLVFSVKRGCAG